MFSGVEVKPEKNMNLYMYTKRSSSSRTNSI